MSDENILSNYFGNIVLILGPWRKVDNETDKNLVSVIRELFEIATKEDFKIEYFPISAENLPVIPEIDDTQDHTFDYMTFRQKLHLLIAASRFVVIEDSYPSGAILEMGYIKNCGTIAIVLRRADMNNSTSMTLDFEIHSSDFGVFYYNNFEDLIKVLKEGAQWAEKRIRDRHETLIGVFQQKVPVQIVVILDNGKRQTITKWYDVGTKVSDIILDIRQNYEKYGLKSIGELMFINLTDNDIYPIQNMPGEIRDREIRLGDKIEIVSVNRMGCNEEL